MIILSFLPKLKVFSFWHFKLPSEKQSLMKYGLKKMILHLSAQPPTGWSCCHSRISKGQTFIMSDVRTHKYSYLSFCPIHMHPYLASSLLHFPDGDLSIMACRATQDVAVLSWAEGLNAVWMCLQLLRHGLALCVHHQHLTSQLIVTLASNTTPTTTAHPDLRRGEGMGER